MNLLAAVLSKAVRPDRTHVRGNLWYTCIDCAHVHLVIIMVLPASFISGLYAAAYRPRYIIGLTESALYTGKELKIRKWKSKGLEKKLKRSYDKI
jgi:hypothetical protein